MIDLQNPFFPALVQNNLLHGRNYKQEMHFSQSERLHFQNFPGEHALGPLGRSPKNF